MPMILLAVALALLCWGLPVWAALAGLLAVAVDLVGRLDDGRDEPRGRP